MGVFKDVITEEYLKAHEMLYIDSYGRREVDNTTKRSAFDDLIVERLKSLGYL